MAIIMCRRKDCKHNDGRFGFCRYVGVLHIDENGCCGRYEKAENAEG